jgi:LPXTG-motif cell wall-anchored protein
VDNFPGSVELVRPYLTALNWEFVAIGILLHLAKIAARAEAWRNILAAAYPDTDVRRRAIFGAYAAGLGVNVVAPARGGEVVRLTLARREIPAATYPALVVTLVVEMLFNTVVALVLVTWAVRAGALPLPDTGSTAIVVGLAAAAATGTVIVLRRRRESWALGRGAAVLADRSAYVRRVASWQAADWLLRLGTVACFVEAFGVGAGWQLALVIQAVQSASTIVPFAPVRLGMRQALLGAALVAHAPLTAVLVFTVGMELALGVINVALGFGALTLTLGTVRWRRAVAAAPA